MRSWTESNFPNQFKWVKSSRSIEGPRKEENWIFKDPKEGKREREWEKINYSAPKHAASKRIFPRTQCTRAAFGSRNRIFAHGSELRAAPT